MTDDDPNGYYDRQKRVILVPVEIEYYVNIGVVTKIKAPSEREVEYALAKDVAAGSFERQVCRLLTDDRTPPHDKTARDIPVAVAPLMLEGPDWDRVCQALGLLARVAPKSFKPFEETFQRVCAVAEAHRRNR